MSESAISYRDRVTPVRLGDRVQTRIWLRKHTGRVVYLPGVSAMNPALEFGGLRWVGIRLDEGGFLSAIVDPTLHFLRNRIVFLTRDESAVEELRTDQDPHGGDSFGAPF